MNYKKIIIPVAILAFLISVAGQTATPVFAAGPDYSQQFWKNLTQSYGKVELDQAQVTGINGTTIAVTKNGTSYTINTTSATIFYREYFGVGIINQINVGDYVNVRGLCNENDTISADFVRDTSIVFENTINGQVSQVTANGFTLATDHLGNQTITISGNTKLTDKNGNPITLSQIQSNDHVVLNGIWDHTLNTINFVGYVQDYSLPQ